MNRSSGVPAWVEELAAQHGGECGQRCLGTVRHIDAAARVRGAAAVQEGRCISLSRPVTAGAAARAGDHRPTLEIETHAVAAGDLVVGTDRVVLDSHGLANTHLDGLAHIGVRGAWHGGAPAGSVHDDDQTLAAWASHGIATRAVVVDVPSVRGTPWVENGEPVTGEDIERGVEDAGTRFEPGDALALYMGRDRFEQAGHVVRPISEAAGGRPGIGADGAMWIADNGVSVLCWDFLDAHGHDVDTLSVHLLIWAIGLALVDNCSLGAAAAVMRGRRQHTGLVTIAPLALARATGCMVNPLLLY